MNKVDIKQVERCVKLKLIRIESDHVFINPYHTVDLPKVRKDD